MLYAANMMSQIARDYQHRYIPTSRLYEMLKKEFGQMHSERLLGRKLSDEHKAKISESGKGRIVSQETIQKRTEKNTGKKRTTEQKEKMRIAQLTRKEKTVEQKILISNRISQSLTGKTKGIQKSEETKAKMRKPKTEEHKKAISDARIKKYKDLKSSM